MKKPFAILLILAGSLALVDNLNIFNVAPLMDYLWPSFLIVLGLSGLLSSSRNYLVSMILILVGGTFLANAFGYLVNIDVSDLIFPAVLILIGFSLLSPKKFKERIHVEVHADSNDKKWSNSNRKEYNAILSGINECVVSNDFEKTTVNAVMGGADMDFRQISLKGNHAVIELNVIMGGMDVFLPRGYRYEVNGTPFMGGVDNLLESDLNAEKTIEIHYACVMGGIDLKH